MIKISTPSIQETNKIKAELFTAESGFKPIDSIETPSPDCIRNILSFSRNLEVQHSSHVGTLVYLRS